MKNKVLLSLGSNLGDREKNILDVIKFITNYNILSDIKLSNIYETAPHGVENQPDYLNMCLSGYTKLSALKLISTLKNLEVELGRLDRGKWMEREIDIDIIFYEDLVIENDSLILPHPRMHERNFVLIPANEIEPEMIHPIFEKDIKTLKNESLDDSKIYKLNYER